MAETDREDDNELDEAPGPQSGKKLGLIAIAAALLIVGGIGGAYFLGMFGPSSPDEAPAEDVASKKAAEVAAKITYYQLPEFIVNLSSSSSQTSFIKMKVTLELPSEQDMLIAQERLPRLQDIFNTYLRDLRPSDLAGTAGMYRLKEELLARANKVLAPEAQVNHILFTEILIQ